MFTLLMEIINKQFLIRIEKSFIGGKLETLTWEAQIQEAVELCSTKLQWGRLIKVQTEKLHKLFVKSYNWS